MTQGYDLYIASKAEYLEFENSSLKAQIKVLELENGRLLEQLQEVRDAYDEASVEIAFLEEWIYGHRGDECAGNCR